MQLRSEHPLLCDAGQPLPTRAFQWLRTPVTDRRPHLIKGKKRIQIKILLLFFSDLSATRNSSVVSLTSFSFVFLFHASISSSSCSYLPFFLLALIYSFSPEMGFINHCNAALGKMVLSAGRNTLPLTAPAGRKTLGLLLGFWRRVTDGICFLCLRTCHRARAAGSVPHATFVIFQASTGRRKQTAAACSQRNRERKGRETHTQGRSIKKWACLSLGSTSGNPSSKNILLFPSLNLSAHPKS